jgi:hypothetical protein
VQTNLVVRHRVDPTQRRDDTTRYTG